MATAMTAPARAKGVSLVLGLAWIAGCSSADTAGFPDAGPPAPASEGGSGGGSGGSSGSSGGGSSGADSSTANPGVDAGAPSGPDSGPASTSRDAAASVVDASGPAPRDASAGAVDGASAKDAGVIVVTGDAGVAPYKGVANAACNDLTTLGASWYYNWTLSPGSCKASTFVPMVWGHTGAEQTAAGITNEVKGAISGGYGTVLGFNEPDNSTQSNIPVATAISLWPAFIQPNVRLGSPATQANTTGQAWFTSFMNAVNADTTGTLRVDFIAAHWYGWNAGSCDANGANLESYIKWLEAIPGNRPIWLTEWGCLNLSNPTEAVVQAFFTGAVAMFKKHPRLERYAWYQWTTNNELVDTSDALTGIGMAFQASPATK